MGDAPLRNSIRIEQTEPPGGRSHRFGLVLPAKIPSVCWRKEHWQGLCGTCRVPEPTDREFVLGTQQAVAAPVVPQSPQVNGTLPRIRPDDLSSKRGGGRLREVPANTNAHFSRHKDPCLKVWYAQEMRPML